MKLYLTEKCFKDTNRSQYKKDWEKELSDIWDPVKDEYNDSICEVYNTDNLVCLKEESKSILEISFHQDDTFSVEFWTEDENGKRNYSVAYSKLIEKAIETVAKLVQHGYARLEEEI